MRIRKFFRGSGRVLAFVFVASVIWLLFDMAALRLSINDVNSQLLKELVVKERAAMKRQATSRTHAPKRLFKHPVEKVPVDLGDIVENAKRLDTNVANVYRRKQKPVFRERTVAGNAAKPNPDSVDKSDKKVIENNVLGSLQNVKPLRKESSLNSTKTVKAAVLDKAKLSKAVTEGIKDAVAKDIGQKAKVQDVKDAAFTKAPPAVQEEERRVVPKGAEDKAVKIGNNIPEEKSKENLKDISNKKASEAAKGGFQQHPKNDTKLEPKPDVQQVAGVLRQADQNSELLNKNDPHPVKTQIQLTLPPKVQKVEPSKAKPTVPVKKPGALHKVMALDVTEKPRDAQAMGQFGHAAVVPKGKEAESQSRWNEGHFNVYLSEQIPIDRSIPDTRPALCSEKMVHDDLPTTSVIFCFVDEVWSTLLRSVHSVLNRSPPHLLKEIILVDDCSTKDNLKEPLDKYMAQFPKVRIIRLKERQGLIRARIAGAAQATGEVLTFLDSHIECNIGWLEPLLERVYVDRRKVACPVIEVISDKDMSYVQVDNFQRGIFKWPLVFGWNTLSEDIIKKNQMKDSDPLRCPVMAGGLFSIDKKYFYELGTYDPGLDVWGGENMEISFKIWMCGGEIEIIPCSRVGHIFRGQNPYKFPKDRQKTVERNLARVAEVWLDEYKELFYGHGYHHLLDKTVIDVGNLTEQIQLRQRLKCKSFKWYLENIYPDMEAPVVKAEGIVFNPGTRKCLALQNTTLVFATCDLSNQNQHFSYTWLRLIKQQGLCVVPHGLANRVSVEPCDPINANQRWMLNTNKVMAEHIIVESSARRLCLEAGPKGDGVYVKDCFSGNEHQRWQFTNVYAQ